MSSSVEHSRCIQVAYDLIIVGMGLAFFIEANSDLKRVDRLVESEALNRCGIARSAVSESITDLDLRSCVNGERVSIGKNISQDNWENYLKEIAAGSAMAWGSMRLARAGLKNLSR